MKIRNIITLLCVCLIGLTATAQNKAYAPTLVSPANSSTNRMIVTLLDWAPISGYLNLNYEIQIADNIDFNNAIVYDNLENTTAIYTPTLRFNTTYYWRVRAKDAEPGHSVSDWSEVWSFTTFKAVLLNTPINGITSDQSPRPFIKWTTQTTSENFYGISKFQIAYSTDSTMDNAKYKMVNYTKFDNTSKQVNDTLFSLNFNQIYYWTVRAINNATGSYADTSDWGEISSNVAGPSKFIVVNAPTNNKPALKNNKNIDVDADVSLELKNDYTPVTYEFQVATNEDFSNIIATYDTTAKHYNTKTLKFGEKYYWRARHVYEGKYSDWSYTDDQVWWFTVISAPTLKAPANNASATTSDVLSWKSINTTSYYNVQVSTSADFVDGSTVTVIVNGNNNTLSSVSIAQFSSIVNNSNTKYYWRLNAVHTLYDGTIDVSSWSEVRSFSFTPTGINDIDEFTTSVYPNPNNGSFTIEVNQNVKSAIVTVYDLVGKAKLKENVIFENNRKTFNMTLEKGIYIIEINNNGVKSNKKITIL